MNKVAVLIPAYNEADRIADTIKAARGIEGIDEIVVIDDGSTDGTSDQAKAAGADRVVALPSNKGKGKALEAGIAATDADIILMLDADLAASAKAAEALLGPVTSGRADMTIAVLPSVKSSGGFGFAVGLARWGIHKFTGETMSAPLSGQRALKKEIVERMGGFDYGFGVETGLTIDAFKMGYKIEEVSVEISHRTTGRTLKGFMHRGEQFRDIARALIARFLGIRKCK
ncbi:MAG: glycosyltransferase family 2 protein [Armatimonadota bacterium]